MAQKIDKTMIITVKEATTDPLLPLSHLTPLKKAKKINWMERAIERFNGDLQKTGKIK